MCASSNGRLLLGYLAFRQPQQLLQRTELKAVCVKKPSEWLKNTTKIKKPQQPEIYADIYIYFQPATIIAKFSHHIKWLSYHICFGTNNKFKHMMYLYMYFGHSYKIYNTTKWIWMNSILISLIWISDQQLRDSQTSIIRRTNRRAFWRFLV